MSQDHFLFNSSATFCTKFTHFSFLPSLKIFLSQVLDSTLYMDYLKAMVLKWGFLPHQPIYPWETFGNLWRHLFHGMGRRIILMFSR